MKTGMGGRSTVLSLALFIVFLTCDLLQCQVALSISPTNVTVSDLSQHPEKFDGHLVRVQAVLVIGWEGDNFMSDPNPQSMPSGGSAHLWFYCKPERETQIFGSIRPGERRSVRGWFTGYFHFVPQPQKNGTYDPGHLQFEAIEVSIPESQPKSLADAIRQGDLGETRRILRSGAKPNVWDEYGNHPLFEAIGSGHTDVAEELLTAGADPKLTSPTGETVLMMAAWNADLKLAKLLLEHGAPVNQADFQGKTALIMAPHNGSDGKVVQLLLEAGANRDSKTQTGMTALIAAARVGDALAAEKLLDAGADPTIKDNYGHTAESDSCDRGEKGHFRVCGLVREALRKK